MSATTETATLGGGCFWCLEAVFKDLRGVCWVMSGYAGGHVPNPTYKAVCGGRTGHAEVVQVKFDPAELDYADLLRVFFSIHDPTTADRQGNDVGPQYRSIILTHSDATVRHRRGGHERNRRRQDLARQAGHPDRAADGLLARLKPNITTTSPATPGLDTARSSSRRRW